MHKKSRAYYQYMLDLADQKVSYYSTDDISQVIYDLLDDGDAVEAMTACQKGLDQHPHDEYLEMIEAKILLHLKRYKEADQLISGNPDENSPFGIGIRFGIEAQTSDQHEAFEHLFAHLKANDMTALEFVEIVDELFDLLPHSLTAEFMQQAAAHVTLKGENADTQDAEALGRMGALLMDCSCHREAIPILEHSIDIDAYDVYSWQDLSRCQFELQQYDQCRYSCEMGLAIDPKNPLFNFALGFILCQNKEYADAIEHLELARDFAEGKIQHEDIHLERHEVEQQTSITYELLSHAYREIGEYDKSRECLEILIHRLPNYAEGFYRLATLDLEKGDRRSALKNVDKAVSIESENIIYHAFRVTLLTDLHKFEEALKGLDKLISLNPRSKTYLLAKAELSLNLRHFSEADTAYRALLKLNPKDSTTIEMMRSYFESIGDDEALNKLK